MTINIMTVTDWALLTCLRHKFAQFNHEKPTFFRRDNFNSHFVRSTATKNYQMSNGGNRLSSYIHDNE